MSAYYIIFYFFFFSSRRRHTRLQGDWSSDVCSSDLVWKHGILEAKSDAGFIAMVDKGGFGAKHGLKIEIIQIKAGATLMKALIAGEIDSVDMGAAESIVAGVRGTGVKIVGCT